MNKERAGDGWILEARLEVTSHASACARIVLNRAAARPSI
jgi:hypothetical protein